MPGKKIYFVTDAHLGAGHDSMLREKQLCSLLEQMKADAAMVVFLGDIFDFWFTYKHVVPRGHIRLLGRMAELADAGVKLHFFIGNHDMWLFDYLSSSGVSGLSESVNDLLNQSVNLCSEGVNCLSSSSSLTTARCERDSHSGYEHKCNLFHFLFCFLIL